LAEASGIPHSYSLGVGKIRPEVKLKLREEAASVLPPPLAELVQKVETPFIQAITDSLSTKNVFMNGKVLLVGDAVAGLRPHIAAGTTQGALHALLLKRVFGNYPSMNIDEWEKATLEWSTFAQRTSVSMGDLSQFGDHPDAEDDVPTKA
jgi:2-polyprenyl-6-methoxyphenol hydroxylase-like FAD-dependent oxidoreductase